MPSYYFPACCFKLDDKKFRLVVNHQALKEILEPSSLQSTFQDTCILEESLSGDKMTTMRRQLSLARLTLYVYRYHSFISITLTVHTSQNMYKIKRIKEGRRGRKSHDPEAGA